MYVCVFDSIGRIAKRSLCFFGKPYKSASLKPVGQTISEIDLGKILRTMRKIRIPLFVMLPFRDQISADIVRKQLKDLSLKVHTTIQPVFVSRKIEQELNVKETKPPIVNQQCVIYSFQCDLCDAGYVGFKRGHLHNRVKGHKQQSSAIVKHYKNVHGTMPQDLLKRFEVLKKCRNKFDCLVYEKLLIKALEPSLNVH